MSARLWGTIARLATWPVFALLFIAYALAQVGFRERSERLGCKLDLLDVRFTYSPVEAADLFDKLGPDGLNLYALTEITLDLAFPFIYAGLLAILLFRTWSGSAARGVLWVPVLTGAADLLENVTVAALAWTYADGTATPAWRAAATVAATFTMLKYFGFVASILLVVVGALRAMRRPHQAADEH